MIINKCEVKNILITFLFKEGAGPVFTLEMAKGFAANGCNVYVILSSKISNRDKWEKEFSLKKVHFIETGNKRNALQATAYFLFIEQFRLKKQFKDIHFDYCISTFYHPWATTLLNCFSGKKVVICHDPIHHSGVKFIERFMTTKYIKCADDIIVLTKSFIPIVEKRFKFNKKNIHYIPHGRMSEYKNIAQSLAVKHSFCKEKKISFLFFGRIEKYKGLHILAQAYGLLSQQYDNIELRVVGSGNFDEYINDFNNLRNITIINKYIPDNQIYSFFIKPNTVLVLPYLDASQSGVIPVALEFGIPIIASDTGGLKEQLFNGEIGYFCKPNDVYSLKEKMEFIIKNPDVISKEKSKIDINLESLNWDKITLPLLSI